VGTGAKYTATHVRRSVDFLSRHGSQFSIPPERLEQIGRLILGTDLAIPWDTLSVQDEEERLSMEILAAADLLGQMADRSYLEKLLFLYYEFKEAGVGGYESAFDVLRKTAGFYGVIKNVWRPRSRGFPTGPFTIFAEDRGNRDFIGNLS